MDTEEEKSIIRSKKSAKSLAEFLAREGMSTIVPGGGLAYNGVKLLVNHVRNWRTDRSNIRLEDFHRKLLEGVPEEYQEEFLKEEFSIEEYHSLLNHLLQDEEDQKVDIYARIFQGLQSGLIPEKYRTHLIKCSSELRYFDFELMRQLYYHQTYQSITEIESTTSTNDPIQKYSIQTLIRLGFLSDREGSRPPWPTDLLIFIVGVLYDRKDLTPQSMGKRAKIAKSEMLEVFIACDALNDYQEILSDLTTRLYRFAIKHIIGNPTRSSLPILIAPIIAICVSTKGSPIENLQKFVKTDKKIVAQILLPGATKDDLPIKEAPTFDLTEGDLNQIDNFVRFVDAVTQLLIEKGLITEQEFFTKLKQVQHDYESKRSLRQ